MTDFVEAAILFADVAGSTALYEELGDASARAAVEQCLGLLEAIGSESQGRRVKTIGDEIMCHFPSAQQAVQAAMAMQRGLAAEPAPLEVPLKVRIGVHFGAMIPIGDDFYGDAVNMAARMTAIARAGQIITTQSSVAQLDKATQAVTRRFDSAAVRGKREEVEIHEVLWENRDVTQMLTTPSFLGGSVALHVDLKCAGEQRRLRAQDVPCIIGRELDCDFAVPSAFASRHHARIEYRRGKFILIDQSTNGTYVTLAQAGTALPHEIYLRREELPLQRSGVICLGESLSQNPEFRIEFDCR